MKTKAHRFAGRYLSALRTHLTKPSGASPGEAATLLGQQAHHLRLTIGDVTEIHVQSLAALTTSDFSARSRIGAIRRSHTFIAAVSEALEGHCRIKRANTERLRSMIATLTDRTKDLAASNKKLKREISQRLTAEQSLRKSEQKTLDLLGQSRRMQEELRKLSRRLLRAQEDERKRISRELHDVVAQALTSINLRLDLLKTHSASSAKELHTNIATAQKLVHESVEIVHRFARDLRPTVLDDLGLVPALRSLLKVVESESGLKIGFSAFPGVETLDAGMKTVLYRVVQESLSNVTQHAEATRATLRISNFAGGISMTIHDNGKGFAVNAPATAASLTHLGLLGMRERVEMINGTFQVASQEGGHTTIRVTLPRGGPDRPRTGSKAGIGR
jgi:signal transduction histidine kinase